VPLGALVVVDECPQYWGTDRQLHPAHLLFFREHRHICAADGTACDLVLISQTVDAIHRSLRGLAQFQMDFRKLAALGLSSKYSMVTYEGARTRQFKKHVLGRANGSYDKRIFPLYQSFASKHGKILQTDKRLTIWSNKLFWVVVVIAPVLFCGSLWMLYHQFFAPKSVAAPVSIDGVPLPAGAVPPLPVTRSLAQRAMAPVAPPVAPSAPPVSPWRVAGSARFSGAAWAVLRRPGYPLRYVPLGICQLSFGLPTSCRAGDELFEPEDGSSGSSGGSVAGAWGPDAAAARSVKR
jgi:zona occludens toxin